MRIRAIPLHTDEFQGSSRSRKEARCKCRRLLCQTRERSRAGRRASRRPTFTRIYRPCALFTIPLSGYLKVDADVSRAAILAGPFQELCDRDTSLRFELDMSAIALPFYRFTFEKDDEDLIDDSDTWFPDSDDELPHGDGRSKWSRSTKRQARRPSTPGSNRKRSRTSTRSSGRLAMGGDEAKECETGSGPAAAAETTSGTMKWILELASRLASVGTFD